jgi:putative transposase
VPSRLKRYYNAKHLHFITCSCYRRRQRLGTPQRRDLFLKVLEQARQRYQFVVVGYVVMPEHFHLLISEPEKGDPSVVMKVVKQRFARMVHKKRSSSQLDLWAESEDEHVWQKRFYDFNVWSERKRVEKLRYVHRNPVKRGLVATPEQWAWSSFRAYAYGETGRVRVNFQEWAVKVKPGKREGFGESSAAS